MGSINVLNIVVTEGTSNKSLEDLIQAAKTSNLFTLLKITQRFKLVCFDLESNNFCFEQLLCLINLIKQNNIDISEIGFKLPECKAQEASIFEGEFRSWCTNIWPAAVVQPLFAS